MLPPRNVHIYTYDQIQVETMNDSFFGGMEDLSDYLSDEGTIMDVI